MGEEIAVLIFFWMGDMRGIGKCIMTGKKNTPVGGQQCITIPIVTHQQSIMLKLLLEK